MKIFQKTSSSISFASAMILTSALLLSASSCVNVSYSGAKYPPTEKVEVLKDKTVPDGYIVIGKATAKGPSADFSNQDIIKKLSEKAKEEGADAIIVVSLEKLPYAKVRTDEFLDTDQGDANLGWGLDDSFEGDIRQVDYDFMETGSGKTQETEVFTTIVKSLFLRKKQ